MRITAPSLTFSEALPTYRADLEYQGKSDKTVLAYLGALKKLVAFVGDRPLSDVGPNEIKAFIVHVQRDPRYSQNSLNNYVRSLRPFFKWAIDAGEIDVNPMDKVSTPKAADTFVPVPLDADLERLIASIGVNRDFTDRRDRAIIRLFMATGIRRAELAGMRVGDYNADLGTVTVTGKGNRTRIVGISGDKAVDALNTYLRTRPRHPAAMKTDRLWLGEKGPLTPMGVYQMLRRRAAKAGIAIHPHQFRHWYAHQWLAAGGGETALQTSAGWRSRQMLGRYGASAGAARAAAEGRRLAVADRVG